MTCRASRRIHDSVIGTQCGGGTVGISMSPAISPVVTLDRVTLRFGSQVALDAVSASIRPGEFVAIIGRSGAGKTTLLRCLSRSIVATEGAVCFGGRNLRPLRGAALRIHRAQVGVIYQQFNLVKRLRVLDNVVVGRLAHLHGWARWAALLGYFEASQREIALRCLDHVGLLGRVWQRADTLSGGEIPTTVVPWDQAPTMTRTCNQARARALADRRQRHAAAEDFRWSQHSALRRCHAA